MASSLIECMMGTHQVIESLFILKQGAGHPVILPACCAAASAADCGSLIVDGIVVAAAYRGPGCLSTNCPPGWYCLVN